MKRKKVLYLSLFIVPWIAAGLSQPWTWAEPEPRQGGMYSPTEAGVGHPENDQAKRALIQKFEPVFGGQTGAIVTALLDGTSYTLTMESKQPDGSILVETLVIVPAGEEMRMEDVETTLVMAEEQLRRTGISRPGPDESRAVLIGGTVRTEEGKVVELPGVVTLKRQGKTWEQVAEELHLEKSILAGKIGAVRQEIGAVPQVGTEAPEETEAGDRSPNPTEPPLVSGEPYPGFLRGVSFPLNGPIIEDEIVLEAPSRSVKVERRTLVMTSPEPLWLAAHTHPEAFLGKPEVMEEAPPLSVLAGLREE
ncbi:MAG: hypothetical protein HYY21_04660 [Candidatus Tectomicrobia bacterium]|nr:hypothetical protein [Candidatus Tectomicrobia bacterium]